MRRYGLARRRRIVRLRRGVFLLPSLLTTTNIFFGFVSLVMTFQGHYEKAAIFIIVAAILDGLDGRIARLMNASTEFGGEYDSLADVVSFGLAPAFLMGVWSLTPLKRGGWIAAFLFVICGAVRLARFNIQHGASDRRWFIGLPVPMAAAVLASSVLYFEARIDDLVIAGLFAALTLVCSLMMVSRIRYRSFKDIGLTSRHPFRVVVSMGFVIALFAWHPALGLLVVSWGYLLSGPVLHLFLFRGGRRRSGAAPGPGTRGESEVPSGAH